MPARKYYAFLPLFLLFALIVVSSRADHAPNHWPDGAIIYGDWGLYRPGHMTPIYEGPLVIAAPRNGAGYYFPTNRNDPTVPAGQGARPASERLPASVFLASGFSTQVLFDLLPRHSSFCFRLRERCPCRFQVGCVSVSHRVFRDVTQRQLNNLRNYGFP